MQRLPGAVSTGLKRTQHEASTHVYRVPKLEGFELYIHYPVKYLWCKTLEISVPKTRAQMLIVSGGLQWAVVSVGLYATCFKDKWLDISPRDF
jgi:hypothetical protein